MSHQEDERVALYSDDGTRIGFVRVRDIEAVAYLAIMKSTNLVSRRDGKDVSQGDPCTAIVYLGGAALDLSLRLEEMD